MSPEFAKELGDATNVRMGEPLARHTTLHIGGPADWYVVARSADELASLVRIAYRHDVPLLILSGGSNLLVSDRGIRGLVVDNRAQAVTTLDRTSGFAFVEAESGAPMATLSRQLAREGLAGLEWAAGIPGTIGGGVVFNAGAHGEDISGCLSESEVLMRAGETVWIQRTDLKLGYRSSIFTERPPHDPLGTILRVRFKLSEAEPAELRRRVEQYNDHRKQTQPAKASAGSVFKNPPGDSSGRLIEAAGLKGRRRGNAQISELHANFLVNLGSARADDARTLIDEAHEAVLSQFRINLEPEVQLVGDWGN